MAKVKKVSINNFEKIVKENFENVITKEWFGIPITITKTISFDEVATFVNEVVDNCFLDDGRYIPEVMHALVNCGVVRYYTNINLPSNLVTAYDLVMQSGIIDFIMSEINHEQFSDIMIAIRDKVEYMCDSNTIEFNRAMEKMTSSLNDIQDITKDLFSKLTPEDLQKIVGMSADERSIEERVVSEYMKQKEGLAKNDGDD